MKKALAVLLALGMVFAAFADAPAADLSVVSVTGNAALEWISDLEAETNGFNNSSEVKVKINLFNGGDVATSGDGVWGELKIVTDGDGFVEVKDGTLVSKLDTVPMTAKIDTAKIHFVDGDVGIALNILAPGLGIGEVVLPTATAFEQKSAGFDPAGATLTNGFALEITSSVIDANFKVKDNGQAADKEWGFGADATIKAVDNMNLKAAFSFANDKVAFGASADYKLAINDAIYLKPVVAFAMMDEAKELAASALFGWGTEEQEPDFIKYDDDNRYISNKCADGFSVTFITDMADGADQMIFGLYDSTLLAGLKVGAEYIANLDNFGKGDLSLAAKYGTDIDILTIALDFGFRTTFGTDNSNMCDYAIELSTDDVVDNTTLYAKYAGGVAGEKTNKGKITVGAKIAL